MFIILQLKRVNEGFVRFLREFVEISFDENSRNKIYWSRQEMNLMKNLDNPKKTCSIQLLKASNFHLESF